MHASRRTHRHHFQLESGMEFCTRTLQPGEHRTAELRLHRVSKRRISGFGTPWQARGVDLGKVGRRVPVTLRTGPFDLDLLAEPEDREVCLAGDVDGSVERYFFVRKPVRVE